MSSLFYKLRYHLHIIKCTVWQVLAFVITQVTSTQIKTEHLLHRKVPLSSQFPSSSSVCLFNLNLFFKICLYVWNPGFDVLVIVFFPQDIWKWVHIININTPSHVSPGVWLLDLGSRGLHPCSTSALPACSLSLKHTADLLGHPPRCWCPPAVPWVTSSFGCVPGPHCIHLSHRFMAFFRDISPHLPLREGDPWGQGPGNHLCF